MSQGQYAMSKPVYGQAFPTSPFGITFYVSNSTNPGEDQGSPGPTAQGRTPKNPFVTIARAESECVSGRGDTIVIQRGTYTEDLTLTKAGVTYRSAATGGAADHVVIVGLTVVRAIGRAFHDMEFFSNSATFPSVRLGAFSDDANTVQAVHFVNCAFSSDGTTEPEAGALIFGGRDIQFKGCRFIDNTHGIVIHPSTSENSYGIKAVGCHFNETTTAHVTDLAGTFDATVQPIGASGVGGDFLLKDCVFAADVVPTDHLQISSAGTSAGVIAGNYFAHATNAANVITIPAGLFYPGNMTEAGMATARPS